MIAFGDDSDFAEGPAKIRVAQLSPAQALDLAGAGHGALDQATVGQEVFDCREALDVADLVEDGHAQVFADAGDSLKQGILARGRLFGEPVELFFELGDLGVEMADHAHFILDGQLAHGMIFVCQEALFPGITVGPGLADGWAVVGQLKGLDAGQEVRALPHEEGALGQ